MTNEEREIFEKINAMLQDEQQKCRESVVACDSAAVKTSFEKQDMLVEIMKMFIWR